MRLTGLFSLGLVASGLTNGLSIGGLGSSARILEERDSSDILQDIVTWDASSVFVHGERLMLFGGEIHPFRQPVPGLWRDIFDKVKAAGLNSVSFYVNWSLLEGKPGEFRADGALSYEEFFNAATEAGIYLIARPGPYVQAEVSGGGIPGWGQRLIPGKLRTSDPSWLASFENYWKHICEIIADAQITNGGPVIMFQPENEYFWPFNMPEFPERDYIDHLVKKTREHGIVVPLLSNDGNNKERKINVTGYEDVDILGYDTYPLGFKCGTPSVWESGKLPWDFDEWHARDNPGTPLAIGEYQGGSYDPWGGFGFDECAKLLNHEFVRVFYKSNWAKRTSIFNMYMMFGGTNWGNMGYDIGYTSYDYGAFIAEDRTISREKYSELKLQAQFLAVSPAYLEATAEGITKGKYADSDALITEAVLGEGNSTSFFVVRHDDYTSTDSDSYKLELPTSRGNLTLPQLGGSLSLHGRDSKIHVADYNVGGHNLLYSTAEIATWQQLEGRKVLIVYGGEEETHELAIESNKKPKLIQGSDVKIERRDGLIIANWQTSNERRILRLGDLDVYIVDRNEAYEYWVYHAPRSFETGEFDGKPVIVKGGYLIRDVEAHRGTLNVVGDFNVTTDVEIIGIPKKVKKLSINGKRMKHRESRYGTWTAKVEYREPEFELPDLRSLSWHAIDSLPEIHESYDDSSWTDADLAETKNSDWKLMTPVSLYGADYGYHPGPLLFRGHLNATGEESSISVFVQGGSAFASALYVDDIFVAGSGGKPDVVNLTLAGDIGSIVGGTAGKHVVTVLVDNNGYSLSPRSGWDEMKEPRGIRSYNLTSATNKTLEAEIDWKITGNLGGEDYVDKARGPLNEGGFYAERLGLHLPEPPIKDFDFTKGSPLDGLDEPGVKLYTADFSLDLPTGSYDIPLSVDFELDEDSGPFRAILYVNGWQFGKLAGGIGPQTSFFVPEGLLDYNGSNQIAIVFWALEKSGARLANISLKPSAQLWSGRGAIDLLESPAWEERKGAY